MVMAENKDTRILTHLYRTVAMRYDTGMKKTTTAACGLALLGGLTPQQFLRDYWHKRPLLIRNAIPDFDDLLSPQELAGLACEQDVQSRIVRYERQRWQLEQGPFDESDFLALPAKDWTLLVQGVNHHLQSAAQLLQRFSFIPYARLDDLMVSYAPDGGGVGPHYDSYDVFLLQGLGQRQWHVSQQQDLQLQEDAPLRILRHFDIEQSWLLNPGDMLYLPPQVAHWGIAVDDCMTYSIGFRAPSAQELAMQFLAYLQDRLALAGMYGDPDLQPPAHPAEIDSAMVSRVSAMLRTIRWDETDVANFLGSYLSEPNSHVLFDKPRATSLAQFRQRVAKRGLRLSPKSQLLFHEAQFFMNGEVVSIAPAQLDLMRELADQRHLQVGAIGDDNLLRQLHEWYLAGYLVFG